MNKKRSNYIENRWIITIRPPDVLFLFSRLNKKKYIKYKYKYIYIYVCLIQMQLPMIGTMEIDHGKVQFL